MTNFEIIGSQSSNNNVTKTNSKENSYKAQNKELKASIFTDKNGNGIIDKKDFTKQEWNTIQGNGFSEFFNGQKWSDSLSNLFSRIFNKGHNENSSTNDPIKIVHYDKSGFQNNITLIFDDKTKTLKIAENSFSDIYDSYKEIKYDDAGDVLSTKQFRDNKYVGTSGKISGTNGLLDAFIETQGFDRLRPGERKYSDDEIKSLMNKLGNKVWDYYDLQKEIHVFPGDDGSYVIQTKESSEIYNINDKLISKKTHKKGHDEILNYDEQGNLSSTIIRTVKNGKCRDYIKNSKGDKYIYEYDEADIGFLNGNSNPAHKKVIILDDNDKPIKSYFSIRVYSSETNKYYETITYEDGHEETLSVDENGNKIE